VHEGRLSEERLVELVATAPQRIFGLRPPNETVTLVDTAATWVVEDGALLTSPGWSPFAGMRVRGRVREVRIRGAVAFDGEQVVAGPGSGRQLT
jgi:dihydroorotase-like cyclic amidohydrolase